MMKKKYYYKLVDWKGESVATVNPNFVIKYELGKQIFPKVSGTPIFVFKSLRDAKSTCSDGQIVFKCEAGPVVDKNFRCTSMRYEDYTPDELRAFWTGDTNDSQPRVPLNREFALVEWVIPVEKIKTRNTI